MVSKEKKKEYNSRYYNRHKERLREKYKRKKYYFVLTVNGVDYLYGRKNHIPIKKVCITDEKDKSKYVIMSK